MCSSVDESPVPNVTIALPDGNCITATAITTFERIDGFGAQMLSRICALRTARLLRLPYVHRGFTHLGHTAEETARFSAEGRRIFIEGLESILDLNRMAAWTFNQTEANGWVHGRVERQFAWDPARGGGAQFPCRDVRADRMRVLPPDDLLSMALVPRSADIDEAMTHAGRLRQSKLAKGTDRSTPAPCSGNRSIGMVMAACAVELPLTAYEPLLPELRALYRESRPPRRRNDAFTVAVHVRRGDLRQGRGIKMAYFEQVAKRIVSRHTNAHLAAVPYAASSNDTFGGRHKTQVLPVHIKLFSTGNNASVWYHEFEWCTRAVNCELALDTPLEDTVRDMVEADVLVADSSGLSVFAALLNENEVHFPPKWNLEPPMRRWIVDADLLVEYLSPCRDANCNFDAKQFASSSKPPSPPNPPPPPHPPPRTHGHARARGQTRTGTRTAARATTRLQGV